MLRAGWPVMTALVFIFINGYYFNCWDQEEHLPYVYKLLDPSLYQADYLVNYQVELFTVRYYYAWLLYGLALWFDIEFIVFSLHVICLSIIAFAVGESAYQISNKKSALLVAGPLALWLLNTVTVGGNNIADLQLTGSSFAMAFIALSVYFFHKGKIKTASAFTGLAACFQVLLGMYSFIFLLVTIIFSRKYRKREWMSVILTFLIFSAPMLVPAMMMYRAADQSGNYYDILFRFRQPHHSVPSCFSLGDYALTSLWWLCTAGICYRLRKTYRLAWPALAITAISGCMVYTVLLQFNWDEVFKLQVFKTTTLITYFSVLPVSVYIAHIINKTLIENNLNLITSLCWMLSIFTLFIILNSFQLPDKLRYRYQVGNYPHTDLMKMHEWIRNHTPVNSLILPQPQDESFLCEAQRSIPVGYKGIIHTPEFMVKWYEMFVNVYGTGYLKGTCDQKIIERAAPDYESRPDSVIAKFIKPDYRIRMNSPHIREEIIHRQGELVLTRFGSADIQ